MKLHLAASLLLSALALSATAAEPVLTEDINDRIGKQAVQDTRIFALENIATGENLKTLRFMREGKMQVFVQAPMIHYGEGDSFLHPKEYKRLQPIAEVVKGNPFKVIVSGYSDTSNTEVMYDTVSDDRAQEVAKYLMQRGVEPGKIVVVGRGPADPLGDNKTSEGRKKNRRVEITVFSTL